MTDQVVTVDDHRARHRALVRDAVDALAAATTNTAPAGAAFGTANFDLILAPATVTGSGADHTTDSPRRDDEARADHRE